MRSRCASASSTSAPTLPVSSWPHRRGLVDQLRPRGAALLALGDEIEQFGSISELKLREAAEQARAYARTARELGCRSVEVIVTAPGRQSANAGELRSALERATGAPVRVLSAKAEGRLAYEGAVAQAGELPARVDRL